MPDTLRCPDCGHENSSDRESCEACNFPLQGLKHAAQAPAPEQSEAPVVPRPLPPFRPRRPPPSNQATTLWLTFGTICAVVVLFIALKANVERMSQPVPGSSEEQQRRADELRGALEQDSTNVDTRVALADILYNTANWPEAIVHYRSVIRHDSTRTPAIVDLGVCYYNLGDTNEAERLFLLALARDPHHAIALFNLGIVSEHREKYDEALDYYHRALQGAQPADMAEPIAQAMQRVMQKQGKEAPPLPVGP